MREQKELQEKMLPLTVKLLVALTCFTAVYLTTEAADTCSAATGIPGLPGRDGRDGQPGRNGNDGVAGPPGRDGRDGIPGQTCGTGGSVLQGPPGLNGTDGEQGPSGPQGPPGQNGTNGIPGRNGADGQPGPPGAQGPPGRDGSNGTTGSPGVDGRDGVVGVNGVNGQPGPPGAQGPPGLPGTLNDTEQQQLKDDILNVLRDELSVLIQCRLVATSCKELYQCNPATPSGYYNISTPQGVERVYCEMNTSNCGHLTGGWMKVANIDMTDENNACPENLNYTVQSSMRMCRSSHTTAGCTSVTFPAHMIPYTNVCGRARGYAFGSPDAFHHGQAGGQTIDGYYVDGLSVTHGSPRNHIWTFAAGLSKLAYYPDYNCPCAVNPGPASPPFLGSNYFCESGLTGISELLIWYLDDPLWDSQGCTSGSTCCIRGGPWFTTTFNQEVNDDIEIRWCSSDIGEDVGVDQLEIYIN